MNKELALKILALVMMWDDEKAMDEFAWLSFIAAYKYDGYRGYNAGTRFIENLIVWLKQFSPKDRIVAYEFIRERIIYFAPREIERLIEKFMPETVQPHLIEKVALFHDIPKYKIWSKSDFENTYKIERRKTLFMGLSDGARIDVLRRINSEILSHEQIVIATQVNEEKWGDLLENLREDLEEYGTENTSGAKFNAVYLLDDFTASGTSILRDPDNTQIFKGKLVRFLSSVKDVERKGSECPFSKNYKIYVHHYIGTEKAKQRIREVYSNAEGHLKCKYGPMQITFSYGMLLPESIIVDKNSSEPFATLCRDYYDSAIEAKGKHSSQSGSTDKKFGYANCGLPVVFEHNTPNNSLSILHARTNTNNGQHNMRPLFYRRERHSDLDQTATIDSKEMENDKSI